MSNQTVLYLRLCSLALASLGFWVSLMPGIEQFRWIGVCASLFVFLWIGWRWASEALGWRKRTKQWSFVDLLELLPAALIAVALTFVISNVYERYIYDLTEGSLVPGDLHIHATENGRGQVVKVVLEAEVHNTRDVPLEIVARETETSVNGVTVKKENACEGILYPQTSTFCPGGAINLPPTPLGNFEGEVRFVFVYGREGGEIRYCLPVKARMEIFIGLEGGVPVVRSNNILDNAYRKDFQCDE